MTLHLADVLPALVFVLGGLATAARPAAARGAARAVRSALPDPPGSTEAMSGGTLLALAADEVVKGEFSVLGPVDPQVAGLPAASFVAAREAKNINDVNGLTLVVANLSEKAIHQVKNGIIEILRERVGEEKAVAMAEKMATGTWTHDYGITASEAKELRFPVRVGMPNEILKLMTLYPQPVQLSSSVECLPIEEPRRLFGTVRER